MESLLQDLIALQAKAEQAVASRKRKLGREPRQPQALRKSTEEKRRIAVAEEDLGESAVNREQIEADLRFYKGHLGRKRAESLHDEKELRELADGEAIVTCDWCVSPPTSPPLCQHPAASHRHSLGPSCPTTTHPVWRGVVVARMCVFFNTKMLGILCRGKCLRACI